MNVFIRQILSDAWVSFETYGVRPTMAGAIRIAREYGVKFSDADARKFIQEKFGVKS